MELCNACEYNVEYLRTVRQWNRTMIRYLRCVIPCVCTDFTVTKRVRNADVTFSPKFAGREMWHFHRNSGPPRNVTFSPKFAPPEMWHFHRKIHILGTPRRARGGGIFRPPPKCDIFTEIPGCTVPELETRTVRTVDFRVERRMGPPFAHPLCSVHWYSVGAATVKYQFFHYLYGPGIHAVLQASTNRLETSITDLDRRRRSVWGVIPHKWSSGMQVSPGFARLESIWPRNGALIFINLLKKR